MLKTQISLTEKDLISGCIKAKRQVQRVFFDQYYADVFRVVKRYMAQKEDTEDVVIVVFDKAFANIDGFEYRGEGSIKKWLHTIAINESIRALQKIRRLVPMEDLNEIDIFSPFDASLEELDAEMVHQILEKMPVGYRKVFNLYAIDGYTHSEIAELLSISRNTSKSQLLRARQFIIHSLKVRREYGT